jgi:hypothetical protein
MKLRNGAATAAVVVALLSTLLVGAQPSVADSQVRINGASASFQSWGEKFRLWDTGSDGHAVYILYQRAGGSEQRITFNGGYGLMGLYDRNFGELQDIYYKVCVDRQWWRDRCSQEKQDKT